MVELTTEPGAAGVDQRDDGHGPIAAGAAVTMVVVLVLGAFTAGWRIRGGMVRLTGY